MRLTHGKQQPKNVCVLKNVSGTLRQPVVVRFSEASKVPDNFINHLKPSNYASLFSATVPLGEVFTS